MLKKIGFYLNWFFRCKLGREKVPLNASVIITDDCNLHCAHCSVSHLGYPKRSYSEVMKAVERVYREGARMLVITGGEPFLWRDGDCHLDQVIESARTMGFFRVVVCTNGTFELNSKADYLWVSMDGGSLDHNKLRGDIYSQVLAHITQSSHPGIYINFTVSALNHSGLKQSAESMFEIKNVRGVFFHIFTPYLGSDSSLKLDPQQREVVMDQLFDLKRKHPIKVVNTFDGLKYLKNNQWKRPVWASVTMNQRERGVCCCRKGIYDENVCHQCGCSPAVESFVLQEVKPLAVLENLRFL